MKRTTQDNGVRYDCRAIVVISLMQRKSGIHTSQGLDMSDKLAEIITEALAFRDERDWERFHDPKNLAEVITIETAELLENFLWATTD